MRGFWIVAAVGCASANDARIGTDADGVDSFVTDACAPRAEICNGMDDDCDLAIDEEFPTAGTACTVGTGACTASGVLACSPDGSALECAATAGAPGTELCDSVDNDCDTSIDEDFAVGMPCDGADADTCAEGVVVCDGSGGTTCSDTTANAVELCNGIDDDCVNGIDDSFPVGQACTVGLGQCARTGALVCDGAQTGTQCNAIAGAAAAETCENSLDEDCNGVDASCPSNDRATGAIDISNGGTFTVDLAAAHDDNWAVSQLPALDCGEQGGRDVFYQFTLPAEEIVYFDTFGSSFDSVVRVFDGACTAIGATRACNDDRCSQTRSQGAIDLAAGTYCLVVDQFASTVTTGATTLAFRRGGRAGTVLPSTSGSISGTTTGKTNLSTASCEANTTPPDLAYAFLSCPSITYTVGVDTCTGSNFDTVLSMRTGSALSTDTACNDDFSGCGTYNSKLTGKTVTGASLQWFIVDGYTLSTGGHGNFTLTYTIQ